LKKLELKLREIKLVLFHQLKEHNGRLQADKTDEGFAELQRVRKQMIKARVKTQHSYDVLNAPKYNKFKKVEKKVI